MEMKANVGVSHMQLSAVVHRCNCGNGTVIHPGAPCPTPLLEDRGTVSYWDRNPIKRGWWKLKQYFKRS